jgi:hypothetical protein
VWSTVKWPFHTGASLPFRAKLRAMKPDTRLSWSFVRGYRFEKLLLLAIIGLLAIGEAGAVNHAVTSLFGTINHALGALRF